MRRCFLIGIAVVLLLAAGIWLMNKPAQEVPDWSETASVGIMISEYEKGIYIVAVRENSIASRAGLQAGDRLTTINDVEVTGCGVVDSTLAGLLKNERLVFGIERDGRIMELPLR